MSIRGACVSLPFLSWKAPCYCHYSVSLNLPFVSVSIRSYLMLICRVHLTFLILKDYQLSVYCFKKQPLYSSKVRLLVTIYFFVLLQHSPSKFLSSFLYAIHLDPQLNKLFPLRSSFIMLITILSFPIGIGFL